MSDPGAEGMDACALWVHVEPGSGGVELDVLDDEDDVANSLLHACDGDVNQRLVARSGLDSLGARHAEDEAVDLVCLGGGAESALERAGLAEDNGRGPQLVRLRKRCVGCQAHREHLLALRKELRRVRRVGTCWVDRSTGCRGGSMGVAGVGPCSVGSIGDRGDGSSLD